MGFSLIMTLAVLAFVFFVRNRLAPGIALLAGTIMLLVTRVISTKEALAGFANPAVATVAGLYVVARAMQRVDVLGPILERLLGGGAGWRAVLLKLLVPCGALSAFVNNTPIVAMLAPPITAWADDKRQPPSRYLLPMTYAVSLGGTLTLIGTSTNLVVSGLMTEAGLAPIGMFELTLLGVVVAVVGIAVLVATAPWALRERRSARSMLHEDQRDYATSMTIVPGGPLDGTTVDGAGLRHLHGVFLVELVRGGESISPVAPSTAICGGDQLTFVGRADDIIDLQRIRGLSSSERSHLSSFVAGRHPFFEAVLGPGSPLVGKTLREVGFRARYQAAVVAIHRGGERLLVKLGSVRLRATDTLLFIAESGFRRSDFLFVTQIGSQQPRRRRRRGRWVALLLVAVVLCAGTGLLPLLEAALAAAALVVVARVLTASEARDAVDADVILVIAGSFALGAAVASSGLARALADALIAIGAPFGQRGALLAVTLVSVLLAQVLTCNAAGAISVPLGVAVAHRLGLDPRPFCIAIVFGASSCYLTPLGYQTKMMVFGPGGYRFVDYLRLGAPLTLAVVAIVVSGVPWVWPF